jgi:hypothetical protein
MIVDAAGELLRNPVLARGMVKRLDDTLTWVIAEDAAWW